MRSRSLGSRIPPSDCGLTPVQTFLSCSACSGWRRPGEGCGGIRTMILLLIAPGETHRPESGYVAKEFGHRRVRPADHGADSAPSALRLRPHGRSRPCRRPGAGLPGAGLEPRPSLAPGQHPGLAVHHHAQRQRQCPPARLSRPAPDLAGQAGRTGAVDARDPGGPSLDRRLARCGRQPAARAGGGHPARWTGGVQLRRNRRRPGRADGHGHVAAAPRPRTAAPAADQPGRRQPAEGQVTAERPISDDDLHAAADGRLPPDQQAAVEAAVAGNPDAAARLAFYRRLNSGLHAGYDFMLSEPIPERLAARPRRRAWGWGTLLRVAAASALLTVGGGGGWTARELTYDESPQAQELTDLAATAHLVYASQVTDPVEIPGSEKDRLLALLTKNLDRPVRAPDLSRIGYEFLGGRLLPAGHSAAGQFMYQNVTGNRVTLYFTPAADRRDSAFRFYLVQGVAVYYWHDDDLAYALVSE